MPHRSDEGGQALVLTALAMAAAIVFLAVVVNTGEAVAVKVSIQGAADAAAYSGAMMQARGLNVLAALNQYLTAVDRFYTTAVVSWVGAVAASAGCECPFPIQAWWRSIGRTLEKACDPKALGKIKMAQEQLVHGFNRGQSSPAVVEAREVGQTNSQPYALASPFQFSFQARHWALNFEAFGATANHASLPQLPVGVGPPGLPRTGAARIECAIPPLWRLLPEYRQSAYVFTAVATKPRPTLVGGGLFGPPRPFAAVAEARPVNGHQDGLELTKPNWQPRLVRVTPAVMAKFRHSSLGGYLAGFPVMDDHLLRH